MLQKLMKKKTPKKQSMVKIKLPSSEERVILETKIVEEQTNIDFSDFRQMLKNRGLRKPELFKPLPKPISVDATKTLMKPQIQPQVQQSIGKEKEIDRDEERDEGRDEGRDEERDEDRDEDTDEDTYTDEDIEMGPKMGTKRRGKMSKQITRGTITKGIIPHKREDTLLTVPMSMVTIKDRKITNRLPKKVKKVNIRVPSYYMNNREVFMQYINTIFEPYKKELETLESSLSCESLKKSKTGNFKLLTHQKIVRDYLNIYSPYRGLLLYFGLGAGKTCSSIAIAEGIKEEKTILVLTPASLRTNYISELKFCGDPIYKLNQFWEFIPLNEDPNRKAALAEILNLKPEFIEKQGGAWLVNVKRKSNFKKLTEEQRLSVDEQINTMIRYKYRFINYNGMRTSHLNDLEQEAIELEGTKNPFDNKVVIIDEVHNFVSRIVNKLGKKTKSLSVRMYEYLMDAENCKIVFLTGTPIINYPNEIAVLFNMLRGYIKTYYFPLRIRTTDKINVGSMRKLFSKNKFVDYIDYKASSNMLVITKNPHGFVNKTKYRKYNGVVNINNTISEQQFKTQIINILKQNSIDVLIDDPKNIKVEKYTCLPDDKEEFSRLFIDENNELINSEMFKRRIIGLTSYYKSAKESLLPRYDRVKNYIVEKIEMSDHQLGIYEIARNAERKEEKRTRMKKKDDIYSESSSTYRIYSRVFCNFVFPTHIIPRPMPNKRTDKINEEGMGKDTDTGADVDASVGKETEQQNEIQLSETMDEGDIDNVEVNDKIENVDGMYVGDDETELIRQRYENMDDGYGARIENAFKVLRENAKHVFNMENLKYYSPKFLSILKKLKSQEYIGSHLIYSQFRTLEGVGILKEILDYNGFAQFKISDITGTWRVDIKDEDRDKPMYALYTGTESREEKETIRNIFNSDWGKLKAPLVEDLKKINANNFLGEVIKTIMITSSGAEGITLKNVQYVHIVEPYWHPVRLEQVIGRAVRICSHQDLPEEYKEVNVYLYLMTFSDKQLNGDPNGKTKKEREPKVSIQLKIKDLSKTDKKTPLTTDESLYEISNIKEEINKNILRAIKEASFDCHIHSKSNSAEQLLCYNISKPSINNYNYQPSYTNEATDDITKLNKQTVAWRGVEINIQGKKYILKPDFYDDATNKPSKTGEIYDYDSYQLALNSSLNVNPVLKGKLVPNPKNRNEIKFERIDM